MRYVERDPGLAPSYLTLSETEQAVRELGDFIESGGVSAKQAYATVDATEILLRGAAELLPALVEQFSGKCSFTEMAVSDDRTRVRHHLLRPGQGARQERGSKPSEGHYWWLVNDWSNIYLAEQNIDSIKGQVFPVHGDRQADPAAVLDSGLLLDPCRDVPEWYLRFGDSGGVNAHAPVHLTGAEAEAHRLRGSLSIRLYGLARPEVRSSRTRALGSNSPAGDTDAGIMAALESLDVRTPHLGAVKQMLARRVLRLKTAPSDELVRALQPDLQALAGCDADAQTSLMQLLGDRFDLLDPPSAAGSASTSEPADSSLSSVSSAFRDLVDPGHPVADAAPPEPVPDSPPVSASPSDPAPQGSASQGSASQDSASQGSAPQQLAPKITRVTVENFKAIHELEITIDGIERLLSEPNRYQRMYEARAAQGDDPGTTFTDAATAVVETRVLIGENGSGKSSVLQAIALTLASDAERALVDEDLKDFIRWDLTEHGPQPNPHRQAKVTVEMLGATFNLTIKPDGTVIHEAVDASGEPIDTTGESPWFLMRAYSATRTLKGEDSSHEPLSIRNLFDPRVPLVKPEAWLLSLDETQFGTVAATLHQLFNESNADGSSPGPTFKMERVPAEAPTKIVVGNVELRHLSDGYRAVITLFCDIMAAAQELNPTDMRSAEGILLIDEIGAHLHPRWRTRISSLIRREFARMQIIVSTHEPLCMRGFLGGEVILVERDSDRGVQLTPIERNPTGLRVDQLLTSEFFGLYTTLDPDENDRLNLYYQLRAKKAQQEGGLAAWEAELLDRVRPIETEQVFGFSYREQLTYEAIDQYLTDRRSRISPEAERERRGAAFKEVTEIWRAFERQLDSDDAT